VLASTLEVAHGVLEHGESVVREPGVLQGDVPARQSPLDDGTDLVEVGVAREDEEGRRLGAELAPNLVQEREVDPDAGQSCCELDHPRACGDARRRNAEDDVDQAAEERVACGTGRGRAPEMADARLVGAGDPGDRDRVVDAEGLPPAEVLESYLAGRGPQG
jgi:hypothetical protein